MSGYSQSINLCFRGAGIHSRAIFQFFTLFQEFGRAWDGAFRLPRILISRALQKQRNPRTQERADLTGRKKMMSNQKICEIAKLHRRRRKKQSFLTAFTGLTQTEIAPSKTRRLSVFPCVICKSSVDLKWTE